MTSGSSYEHPMYVQFMACIQGVSLYCLIRSNWTKLDKKITEPYIIKNKNTKRFLIDSGKFLNNKIML